MLSKDIDIEHDVLIKDEGDFLHIKLLTEKARQRAKDDGICNGENFALDNSTHASYAMRKWCKEQNLTYQEF